MKYIAIDIETSGKYPVPSRRKIFCLAYNDGIKAPKLLEGDSILSFKAILEDPKIVKVIHNAAFDCFWLLHVLGIRVVNIWDTMLMEQILMGETLSYKVKDEEKKKELSANLLYTLQRYGIATLQNKDMGEHFSRRPLNTPLTKVEKDYALNDVRYLLKLQAMQEYRVTKLGLARLAGLENKTVEAVVGMQNRGILFSRKIWLDIARENESNFNYILKRLPSEVANWNSPKQVKDYFKKKGIYIASFDDLDEIALTCDDPVFRKFIELRSYYKNVTTYGRGWLEDEEKGSTLDPDGRIRDAFNQIKNTGRFSTKRLQVIPKESQHRAAFVPAKGKCFVVGDFEQQEIGIMAAASKEEIWIKALLRKEDIHSLTASLIYPSEWRQGREKNCIFPKKCKCKIHSHLRFHAKTINFAIAYGAGAIKIGKKLNLNKWDSIALLAKYKNVVPNLIRWLENNAKEAIKTRLSFSADPYKRRRVLRDPEDWMLKTVGMNNPVQSVGANMIKLTMISLPSSTPLVLTVHDELILEVDNKPSVYKKAAKDLKGYMEKAADFCTGIPGLIQVEPTIKFNLLKE